MKTTTSIGTETSYVGLVALAIVAAIVLAGFTVVGLLGAVIG